jgi:non-ribosomal peptide synthetase component F
LWPDQTAITFREARLTFAELSEQVDKASRGLLARGVRKGDIVGI